LLPACPRFSQPSIRAAAGLPDRRHSPRIFSAPISTLTDLGYGVPLIVSVHTLSAIKSTNGLTSVVVR
jgi:hypothetical protein